MSWSSSCMLAAEWKAIAVCCALQHLPLVVDKEAFRPACVKGSNVQLHLPKNYPTEGLSRRDVHGDMGLVVIALNWPR